jgi:hypothetical protein
VAPAASHRAPRHRPCRTRHSPSQRRSPARPRLGTTPSIGGAQRPTTTRAACSGISVLVAVAQLGKWAPAQVARGVEATRGLRGTAPGAEVHRHCGHRRVAWLGNWGQALGLAVRGRRVWRPRAVQNRQNRARRLGRKCCERRQSRHCTRGSCRTGRDSKRSRAPCAEAPPRRLRTRHQAPSARKVTRRTLELCRSVAATARGATPSLHTVFRSNSLNLDYPR